MSAAGWAIVAAAFVVGVAVGILAYALADDADRLDAEPWVEPSPFRPAREPMPRHRGRP